MTLIIIIASIIIIKIRHRPKVNSSDTSPSPRVFVANTDTEGAIKGEQSEEERLNTWMHTPLVHKRAGMIAESHVSPAVELV